MYLLLGGGKVRIFGLSQSIAVSKALHRVLKITTSVIALQKQSHVLQIRKKMSKINRDLKVKNKITNNVEQKYPNSLQARRG